METTQRKEHVYFLKAKGVQRVKIGFTTSKPNLRKDGIQTMSPVKLYRIALISTPPGYARTLEKRLHKLFEANRVWGEWFEFPSYSIGTLKKCFKKKDVDFDVDKFEAFWKREIYGKD